MLSSTVFGTFQGKFLGEYLKSEQFAELSK